MSDKIDITLTINGRDYPISVAPRKTLVDAIREDCGQTGTHIGCEHGICGTCTVIIGGDAVRSCLMFAVQADGHEVRTVEDLANGDGLHPLQQAFHASHALQCGFCTPGILMTLVAFLRDHPNPEEQQIREAISGNLCRCTGYANIVEAVKRMGNGESAMGSAE